MRTRYRRTITSGIAAVVCGALVGCAGVRPGDDYLLQLAPDPAHSTAPEIPDGAASLPEQTAIDCGQVGVEDGAASLLRCIEIKGRAPMTAFDRSQFGQRWADEDRNGCDTRNDILRRDLQEVQLKPGTRGCVVLSGVLKDTYTGKQIHFIRGQDTSSDVQIDHVVALGNAWQTGGQQLSPERRQQFANDPANLRAVDGRSNQSKGAADLATWLPPNRKSWCGYATQVVTVKFVYELWMTAAEHRRAGELLQTC